jgi:hypothetical protein
MKGIKILAVVTRKVRSIQHYPVSRILDDFGTFSFKKKGFSFRLQRQFSGSLCSIIAGFSSYSKYSWIIFESISSLMHSLQCEAAMGCANVMAVSK